MSKIANGFKNIQLHHIISLTSCSFIAMEYLEGVTLKYR